MDSIRRHHFSLTYVAAGLMLTIALIAAGAEPPDEQGILMIGLFIGQLWLIGGWGAAGRASRLVRGCGVLGGMVVMTTTISFVYRSVAFEDDWARALGPNCMIMAPTFVVALLTKIYFDWKGIERGKTFQFQIKEILGWMVFVAVAATILGIADFRIVFSKSEPLVQILVVGGAAGLLIAVHRYRRSLSIGWTILCWSVFIATVASFFANRNGASGHDISVAFLASAAYLGGALFANACEDGHWKSAPTQILESEPLCSTIELD